MKKIHITTKPIVFTGRMVDRSIQNSNIQVAVKDDIILVNGVGVFDDPIMDSNRSIPMSLLRKVETSI